MHKSRNLSDRMMLRTFFNLYHQGWVSRAEYMGMQPHYRPRAQPREPAEPFRPRKRRALSAGGRRRARR